jgi:hypothetical protein
MSDRTICLQERKFYRAIDGPLPSGMGIDDESDQVS